MSAELSKEAITAAVAALAESGAALLKCAEIRKSNAEAELLEAQARDIRAQAVQREQANTANAIILSLQKLQVERDIANFGKAPAGKEN